MLLSEAILLWKNKGLSRNEALIKAKDGVKKIGLRWTKGKQALFDEVYTESTTTVLVKKPEPKVVTELQKLEERFNTFSHKVNKLTALVFYYDVWKYYNHLYFGNKLPKPSFRFIKDAGLYFRVRAHYRASRNELSFNRRLFNAKFEDFCITMVHEMCHQAVHKLDNAEGYYRANNRRDVHGEPWKKWMRHCGIEPNRLHKSEYIDYMDEEEKQEEQEKKDLVTKELKDKIKIEPEKYKAAQIFSVKEKRWLKGVIVCPLDKNNKYWAFNNKLDGNTYLKVPSSLFHELPKTPENLEYYSSEWNAKAKHLDILIASQKQKQDFAKKYTKPLQEIFGLIPQSRRRYLEIVVYILTRTRASEGNGSYNLSEFGYKYNHDSLVDALNWMQEVDGRRCVDFNTTAGLNSLSLTPKVRSKAGRYRLDDFLKSLKEFYQ